MLREGDGWLLKLRPMALLAIVVAVMIASAAYYTPPAEYVDIGELAKLEMSRRAQGPALIATRDPSMKFLTRFVFLAFFVYFIRSPRDIKLVVAMIIACVLLTYTSVSMEVGPFGWGGGRLRVLGEEGAAIYAGRNPNKLAYFALFGLTLLWYARRAIRSALTYPFWVAATGIAFIMIPLTGSRSGLLNLLLFVAIVLLEGRFSYRKIVGLALVTLTVIVQFGYDTSIIDVIFPEEVASRLQRFDVRREVITEGVEAQGSAEGRVLTARAALKAWQTHPFFGVGIGNFETERAATDPTGMVGPPHNSYLWSLAEGGLFTLLLFLAVFAWTFRAIRSIEWEYEARFGPVGLGWLVKAMRTGLLGFLVFSFFADMWHHVMFYIIMGMCFSLIRMHQVYAETGVVQGPFRLGKPVPALAR
jgi:O-antigen ligase